MATLKKAVFQGMETHGPKDKTYTWDYVRKQVVMDDLQSYLAKEIGKIVHVPEESFNAPLMAIFLNKPTEKELEIIHAMRDKAGFSKRQLYVTWLNKTQAENDHEKKLLMDVLNSEISVISPKLIFSFGLNLSQDMHTVIDFKKAKMLSTYDLNWMFKGDTEDELMQRKKAIWSDFVTLTKHYKHVD